MSLAKPRGFTLVEMIIVIAMIGILAAIAMPSYREYVMRTNRTVAKVALAELVARQESYATDHKSYATTMARLGYAGSDAVGYVRRDGTISRDPANALYRLELRDAPVGSISATCAGLSNATDTNRARFRISATPIATTTDSRCGTLCVSSSGERGASGTATDCWQR